MKLKFTWAALKTILPFITLGFLIINLTVRDLDSFTSHLYTAYAAVNALLVLAMLLSTKGSLATIFKGMMKQ